MIYGIELTLASGAKVEGALFDNAVYISEPIADTYGCVADMLAVHEGAELKVIGPVVSLEEAKADVIQEYRKGDEELRFLYGLAMKQLNDFERTIEHLVAQESPEAEIVTVQG